MISLRTKTNMITPSTLNEYNGPITESHQLGNAESEYQWPINSAYNVYETDRFRN